MSGEIFYSRSLQNFIFRAFVCSIPKIGRPGGQCEGRFWALAWLVHCPWDLGCRGPGFLVLQKGLRGAMKGGLSGPMPGLSLCPWGLGCRGPGSLVPCPFYGMDRILVVEKVHIFMIISLRECFFRIFSIDLLGLQ